MMRRCDDLCYWPVPWRLETVWGWLLGVLWAPDWV
jgi:hypothetical protein